MIAMSAGAAEDPRRPDDGDLVRADKLAGGHPVPIRSSQLMSCVVAPSRPTRNSMSSSHLSASPATRMLPVLQRRTLALSVGVGDWCWLLECGLSAFR